MGELDLQGTFLLAVKRHEPSVGREGQNVYSVRQFDNPANDFMLQEGDTLALVGASDDLRSFRRAGVQDA